MDLCGEPKQGTLVPENLGKDVLRLGFPFLYGRGAGPHWVVEDDPEFTPNFTACVMEL